MFLDRFVNNNVYSAKNSIIEKSREEQGNLVQDLMQDLAQAYNEIFKPSSKAMEQTYLEGVENCVTKNLYSVLFGESGTGTNP